MVYVAMIPVFELAIPVLGWLVWGLLPSAQLGARVELAAKAGCGLVLGLGCEHPHHDETGLEGLQSLDDLAILVEVAHRRQGITVGYEPYKLASTPLDTESQN